ncbi:hypothetical protein O9Z70_05170 [Devosia sp. YIM 151766]|uniref:hypothetical protein n=1 Tax=Devosia sp. YIM 151766 TaxID=3017325 RepID=UPI00255CAD19|nr:hypothetical protein [Devosia sp. YIM 151766]WIY53927.1 hypothetical protein O9Z70_05170 [Devosia sp. YIM 151766]
MVAKKVVCPVSDYEFAEELPSSGDFHRIKSPPFDGIYRVSGSAKALLENGISGAEAARLATWLVDQIRLGVDEPMVTTSVLELTDSGQPLAVKERVERLYRFLESRLRNIGDSLPWETPYLASGDLLASAQKNRVAASLWTESTTSDELSALVEYAVEKGFAALTNNQTYLALTIEGWQYLQQLDNAGVSSDQAFVAMWFGPEITSAYNEGIAPAIRDAGYLPMRIDQKEHANRIDDEIIAEIRRSRFVVADFTCGVVDDGGQPVAIPRGGVYYEAGFAQGLGIPVIWMCREDHINYVHFDTRQFNHITWTDAGDLREKLKNRIGAVLGDGPNAAR